MKLRTYGHTSYDYIKDGILYTFDKDGTEIGKIKFTPQSKIVRYISSFFA